jgi:hypothetical protein
MAKKKATSKKKKKTAAKKKLSNWNEVTSIFSAEKRAAPGGGTRKLVKAGGHLARAAVDALVYMTKDSVALAKKNKKFRNISRKNPGGHDPSKHMKR